MLGGRAAQALTVVLVAGCLVVQEVGGPVPSDAGAEGPCGRVPEGAPCDDGNACTTSDRCRAGQCAGDPVVCAVVDACHPGACDRATGSCAAPDGTSCDEGVSCVTSATCQRGACVGAFFDPSGPPAWIVHVGGGAGAATLVVAAGSDAGATVAGAFEGTFDFGDGTTTVPGANADLVVGRYDALGQLASHALLGQGVPGAVAVDAAGAVLLAGSVADSAHVDTGSGPLPQNVLFVGELDAWSRAIGVASTTTAVVRGVASSGASGRTSIAGTFDGWIDFGAGHVQSAGEADVFVASYDAANGQSAWSHTFGDPASQEANAVAVTAAGDVLVAGAFRGHIDFGAGPLGSTGDDDVFVARLDAEGNAVWSRSFGSTQGGASVPGGSNDRAFALAVDGSGNVVVGGQFGGVAGVAIDFGCGPMMDAGGTGAFLVELDPGGACVWSKSYGGPSSAVITGVAAAAGRIYTTGTFLGSIDLGSGALASAGAGDAFVAALDSAGNHLWRARLGGCTDERSGGIAVDGAGHVFVTGSSANPDNAAPLSAYLAAFAAVP